MALFSVISEIKRNTGIARTSRFLNSFYITTSEEKRLRTFLRIAVVFSQPTKLLGLLGGVYIDSAKSPIFTHSSSALHRHTNRKAISISLFCSNKKTFWVF